MRKSTFPPTFRLVFVATVMAMALLGPAAMVPDAHAGRPDTSMREQQVPLLAVTTSGDAADDADAPEATAVPAATPAPVATESPSATPAPAATESPSASSGPAVTESPSATPSTAATESPSATSGPVATEGSSATPAPTATARPTPTTAPSPAATPLEAIPSPAPSITPGAHEHGHEHGAAEAEHGWMSSHGAATAMDVDEVAAVSAEIPVQDIILVGATWLGDMRVEVRSGDGQDWSDWIPLVREDGSEHQPDPRSQEAAGAIEGASDPVFVGGAALVQFRSDEVADIDVDFVEVSGGQGLDWTPEAANSAATAEAAPVVRSRQVWGADESLRDGRVSYADEIRFSVVHHVGGGYWTDGEIANGCKRSDDWIRSIYTYHTQSRGWWDIGYNFIVDPCGNVWEGRAGGMAEPVMGAHAGGFNEGSVGVLALGTFSGSAPDRVTNAMVNGIEEVVAYKLGMSGANPEGETREVSGGGTARWPEGTAVTLPVLSAHQISNSTTCPGWSLMSRLFDGSGSSADPRWDYVSGVREHLPDGGRFDKQWLDVDGTFRPAAGDFDGDGRDDILWFGPGDDFDQVWYGQGAAFLRRGVTVSLRGRPHVGDFDGNGRDDILFYQPGSGRDQVWWSRGGGFTKETVSINATYQPLVGDFDDNGIDDVFWYAPGRATDKMWWGTDGGFRYRPRHQVTGDYEPFVGEFNGAGGDDIIWYGPGNSRDSMWTGRRNRAFNHPGLTIRGDYEPVTIHRERLDRTDILWYGPGSGYDSYWRQAAQGTWRYWGANVGWLGTRPLSGDFDGNGRDDIVFHRPGTAADGFWLRN